MKHHLEPDHIWFADDIFGLEPGWVEAFAREVESRGVVTSFKIQARVDLIDEPVAKALARAGCESVWLGSGERLSEDSRCHGQGNACRTDS